MADSGASEEDQCRLVTDVALQTAVEKCGSEEDVKRQIMDFLGFADNEDEPDCDVVLSGGLDEDDLTTMTDQRRYAMCRAWQLVNDEGEPFRSALNTAWAELREAEDEYGIDP